MAVLLGLALAACGSDSSSDGSSPVTTTAEGTRAPGDTTATTADGGRGCLTIANDAVKLLESFRNSSRGVAGPEPGADEEFRARGQELLDEARAAGCPIPAAVEQFLQG